MYHLHQPSQKVAPPFRCSRGSRASQSCPLQLSAGRHMPRAKQPPGTPLGALGRKMACETIHFGSRTHLRICLTRWAQKNVTTHWHRLASQWNRRSDHHPGATTTISVHHLRHIPATGALVRASRLPSDEQILPVPFGKSAPFRWATPEAQTLVAFLLSAGSS